MIVISGIIEVNPGHVEQARAATLAMMTESGKEDGCIQYRFYQDVEHAHLFHVYEEWESSAHLKAHAESAHMQVFRAAMGELDVKSRDVKMIEVDAGGWKSL
ncbi:MAG: putative quinol monooxygenase [Pseudomonadota bacterium]